MSGANPRPQRDQSNAAATLNDTRGSAMEGWGLDQITEAEVLKVVREINVSKSSGLQSISSFIIKEAFGSLPRQTTLIYVKLVH